MSSNPNPNPDPDPDPDYVTVRRPTDAPFGVLPSDLISEEPSGYDLSLVRSLANEGQTTPITVQPLPGGRFKVVDGLKRLAAIRLLVGLNKVVYDRFRGLMRPAGRAFALVRCRVRRPRGRGGKTPNEPPVREVE